MKITDLTPPPVERKFSIEFTENELKTLAILMGNLSQQEVENAVKDDTSFIPMVCAKRISHDIFFACEKLFNR
jgi:hypothetical protein